MTVASFICGGIYMYAPRYASMGGISMLARLLKFVQVVHPAAERDIL